MKEPAGYGCEGGFVSDKWEGPGKVTVGDKFGGFKSEGHGNGGMAQGVVKTTWKNGDQTWSDRTTIPSVPGHPESGVLPHWVCHWWHSMVGCHRGL